MIAVIPMAGRGSRYEKQGLDLPKPLINVQSTPMVLWALKSLQGLRISRYIFVLLRDHEERFNVTSLIRNSFPGNLEFIFLDDVTNGQLSTVLTAKDFLMCDDSVLISSSDTFVESTIGTDIQDSSFDGLISVANLPGDQWSFAMTDKQGRVIDVAEKTRISNYASTGLYFFRKGREFVAYGEEIIARKELTRGEYYVIPVYKKMIEAGLSIGVSQATAVWDMGTPEAKANFEKHLKEIE